MLRLNAVHLAVCLLPLALAGCGEPADHDDPRIRPPLVRVATVERAEAGSRAFTGVVVARTQSDLGFRVAGKVLERRVETGQSVKRGQLLLRLDPADLALQAQSQQRAVDAARARAKKAANDLARYRGLVASGAISAAEFDQINAAAEAARADLSAAQAQANVAQNATGYAGLLADADGVVVETLAEPGQVVSRAGGDPPGAGGAARSAGATAGDAAPGGRQRGAGDTLWQRISAGHGDPAPAFGRG